MLSKEVELLIEISMLRSEQDWLRRQLVDTQKDCVEHAEHLADLLAPIVPYSKVELKEKLKDRTSRDKLAEEVRQVGELRGK